MLHTGPVYDLKDVGAVSNPNSIQDSCIPEEHILRQGSKCPGNGASARKYYSSKGFLGPNARILGYLNLLAQLRFRAQHATSIVPGD